jgi:hypothetical protein
MDVTITQLQEFQDCTAILRLTDGEILKAKSDFIDLEYEDIIVDVLETSKPEHYRGPKNYAYAIKATDVLSVEKIPVG